MGKSDYSTVLEALARNRMDAMYVDTKEEARALVEELIPEGASAAVGGSETLFEAGVIDLLRSGKYLFLDRYAEGLTSEQKEEVQRQYFTADWLLASANAVTEDGWLYQVDGAGTRVAPMIFGPKNVLIVAGINKLVPDLDAAMERVRAIAAPKNAVRLEKKTPCVVTGKCEDCLSPDRICCVYTAFGFQRVPGRIKVILVGEPLGY
ncbi:MAG TPA: lactate utilization protein [Oscillospiraceae bacterium]|nr:lactate utilization protein [Oscillospiraceae bacterium]HNW04136.1 lactate utilization protein [Oscillospiraceae bacterium]HPV99554.1 lactate utilization protein [Oscillospiraceae bacterium]